MDNRKYGTAQKPTEPPQEDFPWPHFASIAMHKLINQWNLQPDSDDISLQDKQSFVRNYNVIELNIYKLGK